MSSGCEQQSGAAVAVGEQWREGCAACSCVWRVVNSSSRIPAVVCDGECGGDASMGPLVVILLLTGLLICLAAIFVLCIWCRRGGEEDCIAELPTDRRTTSERVDKWVTSVDVSSRHRRYYEYTADDVMEFATSIAELSKNDPSFPPEVADSIFQGAAYLEKLWHSGRGLNGKALYKLEKGDLGKWSLEAGGARRGVLLLQRFFKIRVMQGAPLEDPNGEEDNTLPDGVEDVEGVLDVVIQGMPADPPPRPPPDLECSHPPPADPLPTTHDDVNPEEVVGSPERSTAAKDGIVEGGAEEALRRTSDEEES
eukprot:Sspe_Gene.109096::Locus_88497_Transcript_1_1_Confidence_1.000_Length_987::g.109096::m.109096